jgi:hypothetical protein
MSNTLCSVDSVTLDAVTGGTTIAPRATANNAVLTTLTSLNETVRQASLRRPAFSASDALLFGLLLNQGAQVNFFVRRPF